MRGTCSRVLATIVVATLALGVTVALAADIAGSPSPASPRVAVSTGAFEIANSSAGQAIVTADDVAPGSAVSGQVTITNSGDIAGPITLATSDVVDEPGPGGGPLTDIAEVTVNDVTRPQAPIAVYAGRLVAMPEVGLGTFAPDEARTYGFTVSLPDGTAGSYDINAYQAASLRFGYVWTAKAADAPGAPPAPVQDPTASDAPPAPGSTPSDVPAAPGRTPRDSPPVRDRTPRDSPPVRDRTPSDASSGPDDGQGSPPDAPTAPDAGGSQPAPQAPAGAGPSTGASRAADRRAPRGRTNSADRRNRGHRDRGPVGSAEQRRGTAAAQDRQEQSGLAALIEMLKRTVVAAAEKGSFPLLLLLLLGAFFHLQHWLDRRDPKLALAPIDAEPTRTFD